MKDILKYKGFTGSIEINLDDKTLFGKVLHSADLVFYDGDSIPELEQNFRDAIDAYIAHCEKIGKDPNKSFSGTFNCRVSRETHREAVLIAEELGVSLNQWISQALEQAVLSFRKPTEITAQHIGVVNISDFWQKNVILAQGLHQGQIGLESRRFSRSSGRPKLSRSESETNTRRRSQTVINRAETHH